MGKGPSSTFFKKILKRFGVISPFCGAIYTFIWTSGDVFPGFQSPG